MIKRVLILGLVLSLCAPWIVGQRRRELPPPWRVTYIDVNGEPHIEFYGYGTIEEMLELYHTAHDGDGSVIIDMCNSALFPCVTIEQ